MSDLVVRSKSTFCPQVCICCYWERKYRMLLSCHKMLRSQLIHLVGHNKKVEIKIQASDDQSEDSGDTQDLVEMMENH